MGIYLDHNATTPLDERVREAMQPFLDGAFANPSSVHAPGRLVRAAVEEAREQVAALVGAHPSQVIFTSGGTEANNWALKGTLMRHRSGRLAVSAVEHASLLEPAYALARQGFALDLIPVDELGRVTAEAVRSVATPETRLVSVMAANNETGVLQDTAALAEVVRALGAILHVDAVQAVGKVPVAFAASGAHLLSLSAHKIYGPKGIGALVRDKSLELEPLLHGGGQEYGLRGGTEHVAGIVGLGKAAELAVLSLTARRHQVLSLRRRLEERVRAELPEVMIVAEQAERLPNTVMLAVPGVEGETLLMSLDQAGIAVSSGSACQAGRAEPSHVLLAMGFLPELARCVIRISLGQHNSEADIDGLLVQLTAQLRQVHFPAVGW